MTSPAAPPAPEPGPASPPEPAPASGPAPTAGPAPAANPVAAGPAPESAEQRTAAGQSFWSVVVGVPAIFSVLRLGVEAGGELQTTLLLVSNVDPINLIAALFTTGARFTSAALVGVLAIGGVALAGYTPGQGRPALFARWLRAAPLWFAVAAFGLAAITWQILYLPMLLPCAVAAFQSIVTITPEDRWKVVSAVVAGFLVYGWLVGSTIIDAARQGDWLAFLLFTAPPLLALGVRGSLPRTFVGVLTPLAQAVALIIVVGAAVPLVTTPVLPLTVITVSLTGPDGSSATDPSAPGPGDPTGPAAPGPGGASPSGGASPPSGAETPVGASSPGGADTPGGAAPQAGAGAPSSGPAGAAPDAGDAAGPGSGDTAVPGTGDTVGSGTSDTGVSGVGDTVAAPGQGAPGSVGGTAPARPGNDPRDTEDILGHVITVDDVNMVILQESGGVRYVPTGLVQAQVLCPSEDELPRYRLWVRGFHVEDSLLEGLGRQVRPASRLDAACRNPVSG